MTLIQSTDLGGGGLVSKPARLQPRLQRRYLAPQALHLCLLPRAMQGQRQQHHSHQHGAAYNSSPPRDVCTAVHGFDCAESHIGRPQCERQRRRGSCCRSNCGGGSGGIKYRWRVKLSRQRVGGEQS